MLCSRSEALHAPGIPPGAGLILRRPLHDEPALPCAPASLADPQTRRLAQCSYRKWPAQQRAPDPQWLRRLSPPSLSMPVASWWPASHAEEGWHCTAMQTSDSGVHACEIRVTRWCQDAICTERGPWALQVLGSSGSDRRWQQGAADGRHPTQGPAGAGEGVTAGMSCLLASTSTRVLSQTDVLEVALHSTVSGGVQPQPAGASVHYSA